MSSGQTAVLVIAGFVVIAVWVLYAVEGNKHKSSAERRRPSGPPGDPGAGGGGWGGGSSGGSSCGGGC